MRGTVHKLFFAVLAVLAITLLVVGAVSLSGKTSAVKAANVSIPPVQQADNSLCLGCHSKPDQIMKFPNGDTVSIYVDEKAYTSGVHKNNACQTCHVNISGYPHPEQTAKSEREFTLQFKNTCNQCHPAQAKDITGSAHFKLAEAGNPNTPVCASCHKPHATEPIAKNANGDPAPSEHAKIAGICSNCHSAIVEEYKTSVHGAAVFKEFNPDVPACDDCHGIHKISTARSNEFRLNSPQLCAHCHTNASIMDKYGISTNVLNTYVADFHGTTVTLFERTEPGQPTNKPVCYDCHGVHNIARVDDPKQGIQIKENMLITCQKCHPDASSNFQASWMSHYIASPQKFPLVYYVNLFYKIFIPAVLGIMGLFVASDILHRLGITGRNKKSDQVTKE